MKKGLDSSSFCMNDLKYTEEEYRKVISNYINYYSRRAKNCKYQYYILNIIKFVALSCIPVIQAIDKAAEKPWIAAVASSICLLMESLLGLWRSKDKWILYQDTNNGLMSEQRCYATSIGKYSDSNNRFKKFVEIVEGMINDEARKWNATVREKEKNYK